MSWTAALIGKKNGHAGRVSVSESKSTGLYPASFKL